MLGFDVGSSSIKASLLDAETGRLIVSASSPGTELEIIALKPGWAEQNPAVWWEHVKQATAKIISKADVDVDRIQAIGISYQMHGLVLVDKNLEVLRPSIIWCDGRAVQIGEQACRELGSDKCLEHLLNSPGNFTASKLKWVMEHEPDIYDRIHKIMLPGDYVAMKMTGEIGTTIPGLSEGILWDFQQQHLANMVLDYYGIAPELIPKIVPTFSIQGELCKTAADELGLSAGVKVSYRAGDQPNNALSLNVLNPGELAATAGTSGVVYGISKLPVYDKMSRVNTFVHVNHCRENPSYGVLLCVNGTGILNRWLKQNLMADGDSGALYERMNQLAAQVPTGAEGLTILPFGNGAERTLENQDIGASVHGLQFNTHGKSHLLRAAQEGIVFALNYGVEILREIGMEIKTVRAGHANMFLSPLFVEAFASVTGATLELFDTDGAQGAARGAGIGAGIYKSYKEAFVGLERVRIVEPKKRLVSRYLKAYERWRTKLEQKLQNEV